MREELPNSVKSWCGAPFHTLLIRAHDWEQWQWLIISSFRRLTPWKKHLARTVVALTILKKSTIQQHGRHKFAANEMKKFTSCHDEHKIYQHRKRLQNAASSNLSAIRKFTKMPSATSMYTLQIINYTISDLLEVQNRMSSVFIGKIAWWLAKRNRQDQFWRKGGFRLKLSEIIQPHLRMPETSGEGREVIRRFTCTCMHNASISVSLALK